MAKETIYNNTLVSGAADETLTYTRYVKDESSGKSTKELLDEKVNKTDQLGTTQIADKAVTTEKLADESVTTEKLDAASVTTDKVADANITTSKLADSSVETEKINNKAVTTDKLNDGAVDNSKLSPNAVTSEKIKDESIITEKLNNRAVTTEKVEEKAITNPKLGDQSVDGRVVQEASLETKHFANESVTTEKVARKSITKDKLADNAVDASQVVDGSIGNAKLSPDSVTTEKIKDGSVTNEKIADNTLVIGKFDPELRKTIQAATGLPDDLNQMIQDVDQSVKQLHEKDTDLQSQIDDKQQQITANDEDISLLQTRSTQMEEAIKGISASGGASQASAVTYENTESGLDSITAQGAIDELANKKFNKENIAQELGDSKDKVVSQFALPFREIESPEFIKAIVDAEDHFLFGIQLDGSIEWGKGIPAPIRAKLQEIINQCQQDKTDILEAINTAKEELSASITALQEGKVDKEEGKSLIEDEVKECFRVIENEEFLWAVVDSEDRVLFGFFRATGKPYYPLNEMYHVIQNEEFFAAWVTTDDKVLLGIRRDGEIIGEIHAVNALKQVIAQLQSDLASLQEKVGTIDTNLKDLLDVFSLQENPEYLAVEKDAEDKVLSATYNDGSHYSHNLKSESIDAKVDKEEGKSLIDSGVAESHTTIEDQEGRTEITTDADGKVLSYRSSDGVLNENVGVKAKKLELSNEGINILVKELKSKGIDIIDWSGSDFVELPLPRTCAIVNITTPSQAVTKSSNINCDIEFWDKDGNYFKKPIVLNAQGSSSMFFDVKNQAIDIDDGSKIKFGNWCPMDSFHLKKYYIDVFRGQCIVGYWLGEQIYRTRQYGKQRPYDYLRAQPRYNGSASGTFASDYNSGALCHPDGFPVKVFFNWKNAGIYAFNLKKDRSNYNCKKDNQKNIILDGIIGTSFFTANGDLTQKGVVGDTIWGDFEIRNPKIKKDINGNDYNGDMPNEPSESYSIAKEAIRNLTKVIPSIKAANSDEEKKKLFESSFNLDFLIDYDLQGQVIYNYDGYRTNWIWCCWDGKLWTPTFYDQDSIFGQHWNGASNVDGTKEILGSDESLPTGILHSLYKADMDKRYKELRDKKIFDVDNIVGLLNKWVNSCGYDNLKEDITEIVVSNVNGKSVPSTPSYRDGTLTYPSNPKTGGWYNSVDRVQSWLIERIKYLDEYFNYNV